MDERKGRGVQAGHMVTKPTHGSSRLDRNGARRERIKTRPRHRLGKGMVYWPRRG